MNLPISEKPSSDSPDAPVALGGQEGARTLLLRGSVDVRAAARLHRAALALCDGGDDVAVCMAEAKRVDLSAVQILVALARTLSRQGRTLRLVEAPPEIAAALTFGDLRVSP